MAIRKLIARHARILTVIGAGSLRHHGVNPQAKGGRPTVAYELTKAQAAFLIAKSKTPQADSLTALMAEVFAMATDGKLAPTTEAAAVELSAAVERDQVRRGINAKEEREARDTALEFLRSGPSRLTLAYRAAKAAERAARN